MSNVVLLQFCTYFIVYLEFIVKRKKILSSSFDSVLKKIVFWQYNFNFNTSISEVNKIFINHSTNLKKSISKLQIFFFNRIKLNSYSFPPKLVKPALSLRFIFYTTINNYHGSW